jgi:hypothetical protein
MTIAAAPALDAATPASFRDRRNEESAIAGQER